MLAHELEVGLQALALGSYAIRRIGNPGSDPAADPVTHVTYEGPVDLFLAFEVVVERPERNFGFTGDAADGRIVIALAAKLDFSRLQQLVTRLSPSCGLGEFLLIGVSVHVSQHFIFSHSVPDVREKSG
jgi:hypothetical protein